MSDTEQEKPELYHFGAFRLDAGEHRFWCDDEPIPLTPKQFDLLLYFVEHAGHVMKKSELLNAVWTDTFIEETTLARNISFLRKAIGEYAAGESIIETVPKIGYRFTAKVTRSAAEGNALIVEEQTDRYYRGEESIAIDDSTAFDEPYATSREEWEDLDRFSHNFPSSRRSLSVLTFLFIGIVFVTLAGHRYILYGNYFEISAQNVGLKDNSKATVKNNAIDITAVKAQIKVGGIVNLRNLSSDEAGYLDAWGLVKNKSEFSIVPTELMFVSTHSNPNRDNGSGSWKIVSATGKKAGETLVYGDKIHLKNMFPDAGFLDNCGWFKDMPVFKDVVKAEKFAVFTAFSEDRDNGSGNWIVSSNTNFTGSPVREEDEITLENGFPGGGFLDTAGSINSIPAFDDYDGSLLVFIQESSSNRRPGSGTWTISSSKAVLK